MNNHSRGAAAEVVMCLLINVLIAFFLTAIFTPHLHFTGIFLFALAIECFIFLVIIANCLKLFHEDFKALHKDVFDK